MQSFHNDLSIKAKYLERVRAHRAADELIKGIGWSEGKGCAVGCTIENYDHSRYPIELGLPVWLAYLEDSIFEGLPDEQAQQWPERFLSAIPVGADVEPVRHQLAIRRMSRLVAQQTEPSVVGVLKRVRACHEAALEGSTCDWSAAELAAELAAQSARSAALSAAESAASAAWSAQSAAELAAWSAAESAAESAAWMQEADDLIQLLQEIQ